MIPSLIVILMCQLAGEAMARGLGLAVPGPVIGMALLFALLLLRDRAAAHLPPEIAGAMTGGVLEATGRGLLTHLSLLFIPAGVGVVQNLGVFAAYGMALGVAIVVSSVLALLATVGTFLLVARLMEGAPR
jgi:holin-like protein